MPTLILKNGQQIELMANDFQEQFNWSAAKLECETLGKGWRLPTISELLEIFAAKDQFDFANWGYWAYWSSTAIDNKAYSLAGPDGNTSEESKETVMYVRAVKTIS